MHSSPQATQPQLTLPDPNSAARLIVQFHYLDDRWQTRVNLLPTPHDQPILLLRSVEGDNQTDWPPSPALQECQRLPSLPNAILATGMAGSAHWSLALDRQTADQSGTNPRLQWDFACRLRRDPPNFLGATFELGPAVTAKLAHPQSVHLHAGKHHLLFGQPNTDDENPDLAPIITTLPAPETEAVANGVTKSDKPDQSATPQLCMRVEATDRQPPTTVRWKVALQFAQLAH